MHCITRCELPPTLGFLQDDTQGAIENDLRNSKGCCTIPSCNGFRKFLFPHPILCRGQEKDVLTGILEGFNLTTGNLNKKILTENKIQTEME